MRKVDELFERYGESHRNRTNEVIHGICVPLITWCGRVANGVLDTPVGPPRSIRCVGWGPASVDAVKTR